MISNRCKMMVAAELKKLGFGHSIVELGQVELSGPLSGEQYNSFRVALSMAGLEIINDKKTILVEKIKLLVVEMVHNLTEQLPTNFSTYLSEKLGYDYTYLANLFSENQGTTIERFIIIHKIERVKELLLYNEHSLTEIAYHMHYSSVAHLSNQFKKITGITPSLFKSLNHNTRNTLENV